ncbi:ribosomal protein L7/L12 [Synechocystis sp. B12]|nr:ribosomal protein L7/L12 [Synechocystis sp. B12]
MVALVVIFLLVIFFQTGTPSAPRDVTYTREIIQQLSANEKEQIMTLLRQGKKIEAIKICRSLTGCGLKEAKDTVEKLLETS